MTKMTVKELAAEQAIIKAELLETRADVADIKSQLGKLLKAVTSNQAAKSSPAKKTSNKKTSNKKTNTEKTDSINPDPAEIHLRKEKALSGNGYTVRLYTPEIPCPEVYQHLKDKGFKFIRGAWQQFYTDENVKQAQWAARNYRPATEEELASMFDKKGNPKPGTMQAKARKNTK